MEKTVSRVQRTKAEARRNYNRLSRWYDQVAGSSEAVYRQMGIEALNPDKGERILEIGFGTAHSLVSLAEAVGEDGWVAGIDLSDGMANIAKKRIAANNLSAKISLCLGDGAALPWGASQFHAVFMSFTLELFDTPEISAVLLGCHRVLKSGGRLVTVNLAKTSQPNLAEQIYEWFHTRMPVLIDCRPIFTVPALIAAGFNIRQRWMEKMWGLPVEIVSASK